MGGKTKPLHKINAKLNLHTPKLKLPKVPKPKLKALASASGALAELTSFTGYSHLTDKLRQGSRGQFVGSQSNNKPVAGAGRGGKHLGKVSAMGQIAQSAIEPGRVKKKEHIPYRPIAQMHTLYGLEDIGKGKVHI
jgi:hypothetical protein